MIAPIYRQLDETAAGERAQALDRLARASVVRTLSLEERQDALGAVRRHTVSTRPR